MSKESIFLFILVIVALAIIFSGLYWPTNNEKTKETANQQKKEGVSSLGTNNNSATTMQSSTQKQLPAPTMQIDKNKNYYAVLKTSAGDITVELNAKMTSITVNNFIYLAKQNFYNNTIFHRVIKGFMIQGGDPNGNGSGGPGYRFNDESFTGEYVRGTIAMANAGPNTNGSQFFIMHQDNPLPKNYVIFGKILNGLEVIDKIATAPVEQSASGEMSKPINPIIVNSVEIKENL